MHHNFIKGKLYQLKENGLNRVFGWAIGHDGHLHSTVFHTVSNETIIMSMTNGTYAPNTAINVNKIYFLYGTKIVYLTTSSSEIISFLEDWEIL